MALRVERRLEAVVAALAARVVVVREHRKTAASIYGCQKDTRALHRIVPYRTLASQALRAKKAQGGLPGRDL